MHSGAEFFAGQLARETRQILINDCILIDYKMTWITTASGQMTRQLVQCSLSAFCSAYRR